MSTAQMSLEILLYTGDLSLSLSLPSFSLSLSDVFVCMCVCAACRYVVYYVCVEIDVQCVCVCPGCCMFALETYRHADIQTYRHTDIHALAGVDGLARADCVAMLHMYIYVCIGLCGIGDWQQARGC